MHKINFVFFGTPDVARETLEILKQAGFLPSLIVTSPDAKSGRKMILTAPPVKTWAIENNIPYVQPDKLTEEGFKKDLEIDLFIVVAYGKILPKNIIELPKFGSINIHYSLLPKYRGASPVESAILSGETVTGVTIQQMEYKMDSGPILAQEKVEISKDEKAPDLRKRLIKIGGELLVKTLPGITSGSILAVAQNEKEATHCGKIEKEDGLIDPEGDSTINYNKFRAYSAWPRTFFFLNNKRVIITDAALIDGKFVIKKVIPEGKGEIEWEQFKKITQPRNNFI